jgi:hypothetical protein
MRFVGHAIRAGAIGALLCACLLGVSLMDASDGYGKQGGGVGNLVVRVEGLPRGERAAVSVVGPSQGREGRFTRSISGSGITRLRNVKAGTYRLRIAPVAIKRRHGVIRRGATAYPMRGRLKMKVKRGGARLVKVRYGTIRNPGVRGLATGRLLTVLGPRFEPKGLILRGDPGYRPGTMLTAGPSDKLPRGLVARVTSVKSGAKTKVLLRPATIYEIAPSLTFRTKLDLEPVAGASASAPLTCGGSSSIEPSIRFSNVWADGGWITSDVWLAGDVRSGAWVNLDFDTAVGLKVAAISGVTCSIDLRSLRMKGHTKGSSRIPLYGVIKPTLSGHVGAGAKLAAEGSVRVKLGGWADVLPPDSGASVGFERPDFGLSAEAFSDIGLSLALNADLGIGIDDGDNVHARFGNSLDLSVAGGRCAWDLNLGAFSIEGKIWKWGIVGPSSPPLMRRNLWQTACVPPPLTVPLTRAQIAWTGDADVDLYAWDEQGRLTYFSQRSGIPDTELVEDVIPDTGQVTHEGELFRETANPGRRYTLGVCLFKGGATDVTMTVPSVPDPRGAPRVFPLHLGSEGSGILVTSTPEGGGFSPPDGWCRSVAS